MCIGIPSHVDTRSTHVPHTLSYFWHALSHILYYRKFIIWFSFPFFSLACLFVHSRFFPSTFFSLIALCIQQKAITFVDKYVRMEKIKSLLFIKYLVFVNNLLLLLLVVIILLNIACCSSWQFYMHAKHCTTIQQHNTVESQSTYINMCLFINFVWLQQHHIATCENRRHRCRRTPSYRN